ncbi:MAG: hypothetical protein FD163_2248 [Hyphomonadaceae bacterium]|nr:MAG: hypothetical protein FD163_2248 [Hyphomonadaceae bacterium]
MRNAKTQKFARSLRNSPTKAETILWKILRNLNIEKVKFRRQHPIPPYITDFAALEIKLIIEVDGATHSTEAELMYDQARTNFLVEKGFEIIRVWNDDIYKNLSGVLEYLASRISELKQTNKQTH